MPPEARGLARDEVRLAVVTPDGTRHLRADAPPRPAPARATCWWSTPAPRCPPRSSSSAAAARPPLHVSTQLDDGAWVVELRRGDGSGPDAPAPGEVLRLPGGVRLRVDAPHPAGQDRLWRAVPLPAVDIVDYLPQHGRPIHYPYVEGEWPLDTLQNVYADRPGSAEMASAGRPLTERALVRLMARGVPVVPITLDTGVSSQESHEPPQPERFTVPAVTARLVNSTAGCAAPGRRRRHHGGPCPGVGRGRRTGARDDRMDLAGPRAGAPGDRRPGSADRAARAGGQPPRPARRGRRTRPGGPRHTRTSPGPMRPAYLWHEFGDSMLLLP